MSNQSAISQLEAALSMLRANQQPVMPALAQPAPVVDCNAIADLVVSKISNQLLKPQQEPAKQPEPPKEQPKPNFMMQQALQLVGAALPEDDQLWLSRPENLDPLRFGMFLYTKEGKDVIRIAVQAYKDFTERQ